jgi:hypothetical protein
MRYWRWGGCGSVWEQKKPEARKILEKPYRTPASSARFVGRFLIFFEEIIKRTKFSENTRNAHKRSEIGLHII